jgi:hypothetical protein
MLFGNREASLEGRLCDLTVRTREDQRHSQAGLKTHLLDAAARGVVESENCSLGPALTFRK